MTARSIPAPRLAIGLTLLVAALLVLVHPGRAEAAFGFSDLGVSLREADGTPSMQAGSHPFSFTTQIDFNSHPDAVAGEEPDGELKDLTVEEPPGFIGDPTATPRCTMAQFIALEEAGAGFRNECPNATVVGYANLHLVYGEPFYLLAPVYNLEPSPGMPARIGFIAFKELVTVELGIAEGGTGSPTNVRAEITNAPQVVQVLGSKLTLWGVPGAAVHDPIRGTCLNAALYPTEPTPESTGNCPSGAPVKPYLTMPSSCSESFTAGFLADSWHEAGAIAAGSAANRDEAFPPNTVPVVGCDKVGFSPSTSTTATTRQADSPSGLQFGIDFEQSGLTSPTGIAQSEIKKAVVKLPEGVAINPAAANGLLGCSAADLGRETLAAAPGQGCPEGSKIGSVEVQTPLLEAPVPGSVYIAAQKQNQFGSLLAMYIVLKDPRQGIMVKLAGHVEPDPTTGRLTTTFEDLPQLPFSSFDLKLREGPRAPLTTPERCGEYTTEALLSPWSDPGRTLVSRSTFNVGSGPGGSGCPTGAFAPKLEAGTVDPLAGQFSPSVFHLTREDGTQRFAAVTATLPQGLLARLKGVPYCSDATLAAIPTAEGTGRGQLASPSCPSASRIGSVSVTSGSGTSPLEVAGGGAYLAGPYKGAPLSVAFVTPAVAGPFDLGNVVVRAALQVDPETAQVTAVSDPLPTILDGIPLDLRGLRIDLDRNQFTLNPTSCEPMGVGSTIKAAGGAVAHPESRFQVGGCRGLGFAPKLVLRLKGGTRRAAFPQLRAELKMKDGEANIRKVSVALPHSEFLEQDHIRTVCTRVQYAAGDCPKASIYGRARAFSPLLDQPLEGPVYLRSSSHRLPDLVASLSGQIHIDLDGRIDSKHGGIRTTFETVPDAPVSKFVLLMRGGKKSLLVNSQNLCGATHRGTVRMTGQNGMVSNTRPVLSAHCGGKKRKSK